MKTTVKLSGNRSIVVNDPTAQIIAVDLCTFGLKAFSALLSPDEAYILGTALVDAAKRAELIEQGHA